VWFLISAALLFLAGCDRSSAPSPTPSNAAAPASRPVAEATPDADLADGELWDVLFMQKSRVGYNHTIIQHQQQQGRRVLRIEGVAVMQVLRDSQKSRQETRFVSWETPDGQLLSFESTMKAGPVPLQTVGRVVGDRLQLTNTSAGKTTTNEIAWSSDIGGPYAVEASLQRRPLQPGDTRKIKFLMPNLNDVVTVELTARDYEPVALPSGKVSLLRIDNTLRFSTGIVMTGTSWADRTGDVLKAFTNEGNIESLRATKVEALDEKTLGQFDLVENLMIKLDKPLELGHRSGQIRYRVELEGGDPAAVFVSGASQQVKPLGPHTAEITVYAIRPGRAGNRSAAADPPTEDDRRPNNMIQSDNPKIVAMAREAAGDEKDPWKTAVKLEDFVHRTITVKDFSQAFATAAEVAETREGDCTEHSVLLAALARARGIPARVAIGLVYVERSRAMAYHMWTEVYVGDRWIPVDATLARGGIGGAHLQLAHSNLQGASAYSSFLPVLKIAGRLRIAVEQEQREDSP
jgi:hypothetical protein